MAPQRPDTEQKMAEFLAFLREQKLPYLAVCAEAVGLSRTTLNKWLKKGEAGDERYQAFATEVYAIRARAALAVSNEVVAEEADRHAANRKLHLLGKLMRKDFDPPKEIFKRVSEEEDQEVPALPADTLDDVTALLAIPATCIDVTKPA